MIQNNQLKGYFYAAGSALSFGLIPLFVIPLKQMVSSMDLILFYRFLIAAALLLVYIFSKKISLKLSKPDFYKLVVMGILYALSAEFLFWGYDAMSPGIASTVLYVYPLIIALILAYGFGEMISLSTAFSIGIALIGVLFMSWEGDQMQFNFKGTLIVLTSALCYALYMLIINKGKLKASGLTVTFYSVLFSSGYYGLKVLFLNNSFRIETPSTLGLISIFSVVTVVISVLFIVLAIQLIGSTPTAIFGSLEPVVAVWVSVFFFNEKATWNLFTGLFFIILALMINIYGETKLYKKGKS